MGEFADRERPRLEPAGNAEPRQYLDGQLHTFTIDRRAGRATFLIDNTPTDARALVALVGNVLHQALAHDAKAETHNEAGRLCRVEWHGDTGDLDNGRLSACARLMQVHGRIRPLLDDGDLPGDDPPGTPASRTWR